MWAILDKTSKVIGMCSPTATQNEINQITKNGNVLIFMTIKNSPAWGGAYYNNGKFIEVKNG